MSPTDTIVVGVDGSDGSRMALEYALDEATLRNATVRVVTVFDSLGAFGARYGIPIPFTDDEIVGKVEAHTQRVVDDVLAGRSDHLQVRVLVRSGSDTARLLVAEAETAALLVVGHRGRGAVSSTLLGSVGLQCVLYARCPVTVVRP
jgi:nucleotide-binding universal stress UspA family protein